MTNKKEVLASMSIANSILVIRGQKVLLDRDLAAIYGVSTGRLNEAVKRNVARFPEDFMSQLTRDEAKSSRSQFAILKTRPRFEFEISSLQLH